MKQSKTLFDAIDAADCGLVAKLIQETGDLNFRHPESRQTALCWAAECGNHTAIQLLLDHGADIHLPDQNGMSPLMITCASDFANCAELLLLRGANPNQVNNFGVSPLELTTDFLVDNVACTEVLLRYGATITEKAAGGTKSPAMAELLDAYVSKLVLDGGVQDISLTRREPNVSL